MAPRRKKPPTSFPWQPHLIIILCCSCQGAERDHCSNCLHSLKEDDSEGRGRGRGRRSRTRWMWRRVVANDINNSLINLISLGLWWGRTEQSHSYGTEIVWTLYHTYIIPMPHLLSEGRERTKVLAYPVPVPPVIVPASNSGSAQLSQSVSPCAYLDS